MRDLAVQSANDSNDADSRGAINSEATALKEELTRMADKTTYNNVNLLDGSFKGKQFQVGYAAGDTINVRRYVSTAARGATMTFDTPTATTCGDDLLGRRRLGHHGGADRFDELDVHRRRVEQRQQLRERLHGDRELRRRPRSRRRTTLL